MVHKKSQTGFALLISLIVVGVILTIGVAILDLSIKQVRLAGNAKESEIAFHAANAGVECARFIRRDLSSQIEVNSTIMPSCFGVSAGSVIGDVITTGNPNGVSVTGDGDVFQYNYELEWGSAGEVRCTSVNMVVASTTVTGTGVTIGGMDTLMPGFPEDTSGGTHTKSCNAGSRCTAIAVQGYNQPCSAVSGYGVVQREVLLQF